MLAATFADPGSDAPRAVYADWLLSRGDPRGEFITLQLARAGRQTPASDTERALQLEHQHRWLAPLWPVLASKKKEPHAPLEFERGFLAGVRRLVVGARQVAVLEHPSWSTVRWIDDVLPRIGVSMRSLERLGGLEGAGLARLRTLPFTLPLESLKIRDHGELGRALQPLARLRSLELEGFAGDKFAVLRAALAQPWPLQRVAMRPLHHSETRWDWAVLDAAPSLQELELGLQLRSGDETLTLTRASSGWAGTLTVGALWSLSDWRAFLEPFSGTRRFKSLVVTGHGAMESSQRAPFQALVREAAAEVSWAGSLSALR